MPLLFFIKPLFCCCWPSLVKSKVYSNWTQRKYFQILFETSNWIICEILHARILSICRDHLHGHSPHKKLRSGQIGKHCPCQFYTPTGHHCHQSPCWCTGQFWGWMLCNQQSHQHNSIGGQVMIFCQWSSVPVEVSVLRSHSASQNVEIFKYFQ